MGSVDPEILLHCLAMLLKIFKNSCFEKKEILHSKDERQTYNPTRSIYPSAASSRRRGPVQAYGATESETCVSIYIMFPYMIHIYANARCKIIL